MSEPGRTRAYDEDLRWRMVWQRLINGYTIKEIARNLYVAESTVWRVVDRFERTGSVTPNRATSRAYRLHEHDELLLIELVCEKPSIYLREIQATLFETTGTLASASTLCRTMKRLGFTRKKLKFVALQRSDVFTPWISSPELSIFVTRKTDFYNWANVNNLFFRLLHN